VLYGIDIDRCLRVGEAPFDVADAHSADVAYYYEHVLEISGDVQPDVEDAFEWPPSRVLFLHDVNVDAEQRRKGYASLLAADAILTLATQGTAVFAHPGPTDLESTDDDDVARLRSETENTRFLASLAPFTAFSTNLDADSSSSLRAASAPCFTASSPMLDTASLSVLLVSSMPLRQASTKRPLLLSPVLQAGSVADFMGE
jgi:hypothetical protein